MRITHFVPLRGSQIDVIREILAELGIKNECQLYALPVVSATHPTLVLSPIPPQKWGRVYKLTAYLSSEEGALSDAASIISAMGLNIFASWAAAVTASGDGCWTSVVDLPIRLGDDLDKIRSDIEDRFKNAKILSKSLEFETGLCRVLLTSLRVLKNLCSHVAVEQRFLGEVENYFIDMKKFKSVNGENLYDSYICREFLEKGNPISAYCLMTPDTEERYIRVAFLPEKLKMVQISMRVRIDSSTGQFAGYFGSVLEGLRSMKFNLYAADNFMLVESDPGRSMSGPSEIASFVFAADWSKVNLPATTVQQLKVPIYQTLSARLEKHASLNDGRVDFSEDEFEIIDILSLFRRCFLATNAARDSEDSRWYAWELIGRLRALRLNPVNVEITKSGFVYPEVTQLLRACPIVVSLHVPSVANKLSIQKSAKKTDPGDYCSSDWVLFEESYALGLKRNIFRLRHTDVREPRFTRGLLEFKFSDRSSFAKALEDLRTSMVDHLKSETYMSAVHASEEEARQTRQELLRRNLDNDFRPKPPNS